MKRFFGTWLALCVLVYGWSPAVAQALDADKAACGPNQDLDLQVRGCTAILARGTAETARNRAIAYSNRGLAYTAKGDKDRAIADYHEAIRLELKIAPPATSTQNPPALAPSLGGTPVLEVK